MLERPSLSRRDSFLSGLAELRTDDERARWIYLGEEPFPPGFEAYLSALNARASARRFAVYWGIVDGAVAGRIALREEGGELNGHIGYFVRPSMRRRGVASAMLRELLSLDARRPLDVTCDETNVASERVVLACGGVFERFVDMGPGKPRKKRFQVLR